MERVNGVVNRCDLLVTTPQRNPTDHQRLQQAVYVVESTRALQS